MLLWWRRYKHRVELSDTRRDKPPSASHVHPIQRQPNRPLVHRRGRQGDGGADGDPGVGRHRRSGVSRTRDRTIVDHRAAMLAAVNRLLAVRFKQRDALHTAHQALAFVGKED